MSPDSDQLMRRTAAGEDAAIGELLRTHLPRLRAFIRLRMDPEIRSIESCSDLVQSVCVDLLRQGERFEYQGPERFMAWLCIAALNKIREKRRYHLAEKRDPRREAGDAAAETALVQCYATVGSPSKHAIGREELERFEAAFDQLPEHYREVITLARVLAVPHAVIAERMGRSEGTVRVLLNRALVRLATILDPNR